MRKTLLLSSILPFVIAAENQPIVIARLGDTISARQYVPILKTKYKGRGISFPRKIHKIDVSTHSPRLKVGYVPTRKLTNQLPFDPVYLVGTDEMSIAWLNHNKARLKQINATGLLVNVKNDADYEYFVAATGLNLSPISGDAIARKFSIKHYPILITDHLIEQ